MNGLEVPLALTGPCIQAEERLGEQIRAETATTRIARPARPSRASARSASSLKTPAPTVPRPATPILRVSGIHASSPRRRNQDDGVAWI